MGICRKVELYGYNVDVQRFIGGKLQFTLLKSTAEHVADLAEGKTEGISFYGVDQSTPLPRWAIPRLLKLLTERLVGEAIELESSRDSLQKKVSALTAGIKCVNQNTKALVPVLKKAIATSQECLSEKKTLDGKIKLTQEEIDRLKSYCKRVKPEESFTREDSDDMQAIIEKVAHHYPNELAVFNLKMVGAIVEGMAIASELHNSDN